MVSLAVIASVILAAPWALPTPQVAITSPKDGAVLVGAGGVDVGVSVELFGYWPLEGAQSVVYYVDGAPVLAAGAAPAALHVPRGRHVVSAALTDAKGVPLADKAAWDQVTVTITAPCTAASACYDGDPCTAEVCSPFTGTCVFPSGACCRSYLDCPGHLACHDGVCVPPACGDGFVDPGEARDGPSRLGCASASPVLPASPGPVWERRFQGAELVGAPALAPDGTLYVSLTRPRTAYPGGPDPRPRLAALAPDGSVAWEVVLREVAAKPGPPVVLADGSIVVPAGVAVRVSPAGEVLPALGVSSGVGSAGAFPDGRLVLDGPLTVVAASGVALSPMSSGKPLALLGDGGFVAGTDNRAWRFLPRGKLAWAATVGTGSWYVDQVAVHPDGRLYVGDFGGVLRDPDTGAVAGALAPLGEDLSGIPLFSQEGWAVVPLVSTTGGAPRLLWRTDDAILRDMELPYPVRALALAVDASVVVARTQSSPTVLGVARPTAAGLTELGVEVAPNSWPILTTGGRLYAVQGLETVIAVDTGLPGPAPGGWTRPTGGPRNTRSVGWPHETGPLPPPPVPGDDCAAEPDHHCYSGVTLSAAGIPICAKTGHTVPACATDCDGDLRSVAPIPLEPDCAGTGSLCEHDTGLDCTDGVCVCDDLACGKWPGYACPDAVCGDWVGPPVGCIGGEWVCPGWDIPPDAAWCNFGASCESPFDNCQATGLGCGLCVRQPTCDTAPLAAVSLDLPPSLVGGAVHDVQVHLDSVWWPHCDPVTLQVASSNPDVLAPLAPAPTVTHGDSVQLVAGETGTATLTVTAPTGHRFERVVAVDSGGCMDGLLSPGETCDHALSGAASCVCSSPHACLDAALSPAGCTEGCVLVPRAPVGGDGCCAAAGDPDCRGICGDGKRQRTETCDGDCPTACDDGNPCTDDRLVGGPCHEECVHTPVRRAEGDSCCGTGFDQQTDGDCAPVCGNGVVEAGEDCDGDCPAACDDGDGCTADGAWQCRCEHAPMTAVGPWDGCCPPGAPGTDPDCAACASPADCLAWRLDLADLPPGAPKASYVQTVRTRGPFLYATLNDDSLVRLDPEDGALLWAAHGAGTTAVLRDDGSVVAGGSKGVTAYDPSGAVLWSDASLSLYQPMTLSKGGALTACESGGDYPGLRTWDHDGALLWTLGQAQLGWRPHLVSRLPDDRLLVAGQVGVALVDDSGGSPTVRWSAPVVGGKLGVMAGMVLAGAERAYVRWTGTTDHVLALDLSEQGYQVAWTMPYGDQGGDLPVVTPSGDVLRWVGAPVSGIEARRPGGDLLWVAEPDPPPAISYWYGPAFIGALGTAWVGAGSQGVTAVGPWGHIQASLAGGSDDARAITDAGLLLVAEYKALAAYQIATPGLAAAGWPSRDGDSAGTRRATLLRAPCDDGEPCTRDLADGTSGCVHLPRPDGTPCDGDACAADAHCEAGACVGLPVDCDDGDPCTLDLCHPAVGCMTDHGTQPCDDGDPCTTLDQCTGGVCVGQPACE